MRTGITALAAGIALLICAPAAGATVFTVNTTADHFDQNCTAADCTIRDALNAAAPGTDSVSVPAGTYTLDPALGPLVLDGDTLNGAGARATFLDGGLQTRVIDANTNTVAAQLSGVTVRRGNGINVLSSLNNGDGGGILVTFGALGISNSHIVNNAATSGGGIGAESGADVTMVGSTVAANTAGSQGGGIWNANEGIIAVANTTITGNTVPNGAGGGIIGGGGTNAALFNVTVASNSAATVGGVDTDFRTLRNTIVAGNSGGQCSTATNPTSNNSLSSDGTCALVGAGDQNFVNPALGPLTNNGGPTDTRSIGPTSLATNRGGAGCQPTDQRGVTRPQGGVCDVGAFEYRPPRLTVFKRVTNDDGGTQAPGDFTVHVRFGGADVSGSPQSGTSVGRTYTLVPRTFTVAEDPDSRYTASFSGNCTSAGVVTLTEGSVKTCMITNNDKPPIVGSIINAEPEGGTVKIKLPHRKNFRRMTEGERLPVGTIVDTRSGRIGLTAAANKNGGRATADFFDGLFRLGQTKGKKPITTLTLVEKLTGCKAKGKATIAKKKKRKRRLWGNGRGRFQTKGGHAAATVVGTKWLVEDRCTSTLVRVVRGRVKVRDFVKHKTVIVRKGHRYIARAN
jgi:CSLREA domain-containing protein